MRWKFRLDPLSKVSVYGYYGDRIDSALLSSHFTCLSGRGIGSGIGNVRRTPFSEYLSSGENNVSLSAVCLKGRQFYLEGVLYGTRMEL